jgi:hypothetical protein
MPDGGQAPDCDFGGLNGLQSSRSRDNEADEAEVVNHEAEE